ncbi:unnamed protein product [Cylicocyclus nassatus]|uniref:Uncharacterized protein n=1 Tax=Cylicocyclus nassatus TaxID=53992 RepID=A0AA36DJT4_CYLNA|nr:unnamed protein product [Cylicocyclus nassatus]
MMFILKLFIIAVLASVLEGKGDRKGHGEGRNRGKEAFNQLQHTPSGGPIKDTTEEEDQNNGDDLKDDVVKHLLDSLTSTTGLIADRNSSLANCLEDYVNSQKNVQLKVKGEKKGPKKPVASGSKIADRKEGNLEKSDSKGTEKKNVGDERVDEPVTQ